MAGHRQLAVWWWDVTDEIGFSSVEPLVIARTLFDGLRTDLRLLDIRRRAGLEPYPRDFENNTELTDGD